MDLNHIMMVEDIYKDYGPTTLGPYVLLFNQNRISREEALRLLEADEHSPYMMLLPTSQFHGLFLDKEQVSAEQD